MTDIAPAARKQPMWYTPKANEVSAMQILKEPDLGDAAAWMSMHGTPASVNHGSRKGPAFLNFSTVRGVEKAAVGDWIVRDPIDGFYAMAADTFEQHFDILGPR